MINDMEPVVNAEQIYLLDIYKAFENNENKNETIPLAISLIKNIKEIYNYIEPDHYNGELVIFQTFKDENIFQTEKSKTYFDKNFLINNNAEQIVIQVLQNGTINISTISLNLLTLLKYQKAIFYYYKNKKEYFYVNESQIPIGNNYYSASIYSLKYHELTTALEDYRNKMARHSSCHILNEVWYDNNRIFFKSCGSGKKMPEVCIHLSLENFLKSALRDVQVQVIREYSVGAAKSVDIRVHWGEANRSAFIEVKWLGQACNKDGKFTTGYSAKQVKEGCEQLKGYLILEKKDTPNSITKGYLVVIDGRRNNIKESMTTISQKDGMYFDSQDMSDYYKEYVSNIDNFEEPIIMFAEPIYY